MNVVFGLFGGTVGVVVGAVLSWYITARQRRIERIFDMHREFESPEMLRARYAASELLSDHRSSTYTELRQAVGRLAMRDVWAVTGFYQRLSLAVQHGGVHKAYVAELFGDVFHWWYGYSFKDQLLSLPTEPAYQIARLKTWMDGHVSLRHVERCQAGNQLFPIDRPTAPVSENHANESGP